MPIATLEAFDDHGDPDSPPIGSQDPADDVTAAALSAAGQAELGRLRDSILAGSTFNRNPRIDDPDRRQPYQWSWSVGLSQQIGPVAAVGVDYVANVSRNQIGLIDNPHFETGKVV